MIYSKLTKMYILSIDKSKLNIFNYLISKFIKLVVDSFGKSPPGFLKQEGAYFWAGDYNECVKITSENWNGKYCVLDTGLPGPNSHYSKVYIYE